MSGPLRALWCGRVAFDRALEAQHLLREQVIASPEAATLLLCEHPPSLTMGRRAQPQHLLWGPEEREAHGLNIFETPRGGEATLHAPGQLVVYPICYVGKRIRAHIQNLADAAVGLLESAGIEGCSMDWKHPGVWRQGQKLASIGVHVSRGVAIQGLSLNVRVQELLFDALVSCGMPTVQMTSLWDKRDPQKASASWVGTSEPQMEQIARDFAQRFADLGDYQLDWDRRSEALDELGLANR